ncbi:glycosyltransferase family 4 protein [Saccharibacillus sacchari]|uniref:glycosyltransferase family 4 protein n=1 Tax=Saccharibacillus sacchari TaxID=456493 RepID=UPI0004AD1CBB|nr:glycosyltransferase family 4 protein [Saccharibacillus sacchari]
MKIIHFTSGEISGGAARGALFLHEALKKEGLDSVFFVGHQDALISHPNGAYPTSEKSIMMKRYRNVVFEKFMLKEYDHSAQDLFSLGTGTFDREIVEISKVADIVHLHWINNQMLSIEAISQIRVPIIWTLRDMWPFTGGCHYSKGCNQYTKGCGNCILLKSPSTKDPTYWTYQQKLAHLSRNIYPVALSAWLQECAAQSRLFAQNDVQMIPNCIDINTFTAFAKEEMQSKLDLPSGKKIILFGAVNSFSDERKGFGLLKRALLDMPNKHRYHLVTFGDSNDGVVADMGYSFTNFGRVSSDFLLAQIYSAAHVFVAPSIEEAFGKTIAEAMACGTPVVAFNATGPRDIISNLVNGYLAEPFSTNDLINGIEWITGLEPFEAQKLGEHARKQVCEQYSQSVIARKYMELYQNVFNRDSAAISVLQDSGELTCKRERDQKDFSHFLLQEFQLYNKWYIFDDKWLQNFRSQKRKVAVYGAGSFGLEVAELLAEYRFSVDCFIDSNAQKAGTLFGGYEIKNVAECTDHFIFIASEWYKEIEKTIVNKGLSKNQYVICMKWG